MSFIDIDVRSQSDPSKIYIVSIDLADLDAVCTCKAFEFHPEKPCKHIEQVREELRGSLPEQGAMEKIDL